MKKIIYSYKLCDSKGYLYRGITYDNKVYVSLRLFLLKIKDKK